jgi:hypothetical protein
VGFKLKKNRCQCKLCGDIITSEHVHDFKWCKCGAIFTDGGQQYIRRGFTGSYEDIIDLSEYEEDEEKI